MKIKEMQDEYTRLKALAEPIEKATGSKAYGFGPGVLFTMPSGRNINITDELFLERLSNALLGKESPVVRFDEALEEIEMQKEIHINAWGVDFKFKKVGDWWIEG